MEILLLGPVQARHAGRQINLGVRKQRLVLAVLALEANRPIGIGRLVELMWPYDPPGSARGMIHTYVSGLRAVLSHSGARGEGVWLEREGPGYVLRCDPASVDVHRFRAVVADARGCADDARRVELLTEALTLWRGRALADLAAAPVRDRLCRGLEEARLTVLEDFFDTSLCLGRHETVLDELLVQVGEHPDRPRLIGALMLALHYAGRPGEALETYRRFRQRLADELGLDPPPELQELHLDILRADPAPPATAP